MRVIVFDLDDTLYDELTYVQSGFKAVAVYLEKEHGINADQSFAQMWKILEEDGRGRVFDQALRYFGLYSREKAVRCLSIYRKHKPDIRLSDEAARCLQRLSHYPLYIVTDGNKLVQHQKVLALDLYAKVKGCFITHRYGIKNAKPSSYCFEKIAELEKCPPQQIVYIGDNPQKDFVGLRPLGFRTIRLMQGQHKGRVMAENYEADRQIRSLDQLTETFLFELAGGGDGECR